MSWTGVMMVGRSKSNYCTGGSLESLLVLDVEYMRFGRYRAPRAKFPGGTNIGHMEDQSTFDTALRELWEETGLYPIEFPQIVLVHQEDRLDDRDHSFIHSVEFYFCWETELLGNLIDTETFGVRSRMTNRRFELVSTLLGPDESGGVIHTHKAALQSLCSMDLHQRLPSPAVH